MSKYVTTMKGMIKKYNGRMMEDWITENSPMFIQFANDFISVLKHELMKMDPSLKLIHFNIGYYELSGYVERDGKYIYFITPTLRYKPLNFYGKGSLNGGMVIRTATSDKDSCGGFNNWIPMVEIASSIHQLFNNGFVPSKKNLYVRYE